MAPTYGDVPTRCFTDLSTGEIHSPPAFPLGARSFGSSSLQPVAKHPLDTDATLGPSAPKPANCWLLLAINLELLPASLYHLALTEITARCMACETMLGSADVCSRGSCAIPFEITRSLRSAFPFVNQTNLTSVSTSVLSLADRVSYAFQRITLRETTHRTSTRSSTQVEIA